MKNTLQIGPSILTADFGHLRDQIAAAEAAGVDFFHLDVMDGCFVPNISFGFPLIEAVRNATRLPLDVHLMIEQPERYIERFIAAGADIITIHPEATQHIHASLTAIQHAGAVPSVALNPGTPLSAVGDLLGIVGQVLIMSVNPGYGGQMFIPSALRKISAARELIDQKPFSCRLQVDGGVKSSNIRRALDAGADTFVVGSAIYSTEQSVGDAVAGLRRALA